MRKWLIKNQVTIFGIVSLVIIIVVFTILIMREL